MEDLEHLVRRIETDGVVTRAEIHELNRGLLREGLTAEARMLLDGLLAKLKRGELKEV